MLTVRIIYRTNDYTYSTFEGKSFDYKVERPEPLTWKFTIDDTQVIVPHNRLIAIEVVPATEDDN